MLGDKAIELVKEASRMQDLIGPFNEDKVRKVLEEIRHLFQQNQTEIEASATVSPAIHLRHSAIERNKRCLLAYLNHRAEKIQDMRWQFGAVLPHDLRNHLCEPEQVFFNSYGRDLANYMRSIGDGVGIDLLTDIQPPKTLYVQVRCKEDYGEIETEDGDIVVLTKSSQHFLPRTICEPLIRQGVLEHVPH